MPKTDNSADGIESPIESLAAAIARGEVILFVGGGISQYLGLPDFHELIEHVAKQMNFTETNLGISDYPIVAEAYMLRHGKLGALRRWMDERWHSSKIDVKKSTIHNLIIDLDFPTIYTTNYDRWLETAFAARKKPFHKIANMADLTYHAESVTEIIKFHGDFEDDDSLVLTETSYFQRMSFETPLDIRLRADCLARPLLFIGYSLQDINTRYLLFRLQELWKNSAFVDQRPRSYIFMAQPNQAQEIVLRSRGIEPILAEEDEPGEATAAFLHALYKAVAARAEMKKKKLRRVGSKARLRLR
jgi:NAD-dependent SIR2 family protein deacetylase